MVMSFKKWAAVFALITTLTPWAWADCGEFVARTGDSQGNVSRQIDKYRQADGSFYYVYHLSYGSYPKGTPTYGSYRVSVSLNGRSGVFVQELFPQEIEGEVISDACGNSLAGTSTQLNSALFFYARNGESLNAWDVTVQIPGAPVERVRFQQVPLASFTWN